MLLTVPELLDNYNNQMGDEKIKFYAIIVQTIWSILAKILVFSL